MKDQWTSIFGQYGFGYKGSINGDQSRKNGRTWSEFFGL